MLLVSYAGDGLATENMFKSGYIHTVGLVESILVTRLLEANDQLLTCGYSVKLAIYLLNSSQVHCRPSQSKWVVRVNRNSQAHQFYILICRGSEENWYC